MKTINNITALAFFVSIIGIVPLFTIELPIKDIIIGIAVWVGLFLAVVVFYKLQKAKYHERESNK